MFFVIRDIIKYKKPEAVLENVRHLINHDNGHTLNYKDIMEKELNYSFI